MSGETLSIQMPACKLRSPCSGVVSGFERPVHVQVTCGVDVIYLFPEWLVRILNLRWRHLLTFALDST